MHYVVQTGCSRWYQTGSEKLHAALWRRYFRRFARSAVFYRAFLRLAAVKEIEAHILRRMKGEKKGNADL